MAKIVQWNKMSKIRDQTLYLHPVKSNKHYRKEEFIEGKPLVINFIFEIQFQLEL